VLATAYGDASQAGTREKWEACAPRRHKE
jgi:hypothetical protein